MKALAAEMVRNFSKKLQPLGITVKECTGDTKLTKDEINNTQVVLAWSVVCGIESVCDIESVCGIECVCGIESCVWY